MKHLLTLIVCAAVLAWALPLSACPRPDIDAGYFASGERSQMADDLKKPGNLYDLLARRGGGRGQGKGDGSGSGQGQGKGYGAKDGTGTGERPRDGSGYGAGSGAGSGSGSGKQDGTGGKRKRGGRSNQ